LREKRGEGKETPTRESFTLRNGGASGEWRKEKRVQERRKEKERGNQEEGREGRKCPSTSYPNQDGKGPMGIHYRRKGERKLNTAVRRLDGKFGEKGGGKREEGGGGVVLFGTTQTVSLVSGGKGGDISRHKE